MPFPHPTTVTPFEDLVTDVLAEDQIHHAVFGAFQRYTALPASITGTATAGSTGQTLVASGATFVSSGVVVWDVVYNSTDASYAIVKSVDSDTQLTTTPLKWGSTNAWASTNTFAIRSVPKRLIVLTAADGANPPGLYIRNDANSAWTNVSASESNQIQNQAYSYATTTGSANAYVLTVSPAPSAYVAGQRFSFKANFANTGSATLNVNGLGAKTINKLGDSATLVSGDILNGQVVEVTYDGTDFQMVSPIAASPAVGATVSTFTAWEAIAAGDALYVSTADGKAYRTDTTSQAKCVFVGFAKSAAAASATVTVETDGKSTANFSGLTVGAAQFLNFPNANVYGLRSLLTANTISWYMEWYQKFKVDISANELASATVSIDRLIVRTGDNWGGVSGTFILTAYIYADNAWVPWTLLATSSNTLSWSTNSPITTRAFTFSPYSITKGTSYWIAVKKTWGTMSNGNYLVFGTDNSSTYANGKICNASGVPFWTAVAYFDLMPTTGYTAVDNYYVNGQVKVPGRLSATPASGIAVPVGRAVSATEILIDRTESRDVTVTTPSVGASPYTYQNTGDRPVNFSVTGGTVSAIQFSRDNTNFYTLAAATNAMVALAPGDYCKVTYSVAPTAKVFPL